MTGTETEAKFGARTQPDNRMLAGFKECCLLHAAWPLTLAVLFVLSHNAPSQEERWIIRETTSAAVARLFTVPYFSISLSGSKSYTRPSWMSVKST